MSDFRYLLFDCETSDIGPTAKMVELAWIEVDESMNVLDEVHTRLDPEVPISPGASGVHNLTNEDLVDEPTVEQFFSIVRPGKVEGNVVMVAHNAPFDRRYFAPWCENLVGAVDTLRLARRYMPDAVNHKLATLKFEFGLGRGEAHTALGDVRTLYRLTQLLIEKSGMSLPELHKDSYQPLYVHTAPFGKHKGKAWDDIPRDYIEWLDGRDSLDPDLRYTLDKILGRKTA